MPRRQAMHMSLGLLTHCPWYLCFAYFRDSNFGNAQVLLQDEGYPGDSGPPSVPLAFDNVAVGGTFDRLHCGHELLLASTALLSRKTVYVGITGTPKHT
jgi:hypothetical protein